jgi:Zn-dependent protease
MATIYPLFAHPNTIFGAFIAIFIAQSIIINVVLAVFNLWPIPPLDGSLALRYLAQKYNWRAFVDFYDKIYPYGMLILFAVLFIPQLSSILFMPVRWILDIIIG